MANKRMFSLDIVGSDAFLEMPTSSRELYFQLGMKADDDGFVNPQIIMRMIGANIDDLKVLIGKRFVLPFENGVIVIKHWRINNFVRKDRYKESLYLDQKKLLRVKENGSYTFDKKQGKPISKVEWKSDDLKLKSGQPNDIPKVNAGEDRIGKDRIEEKSTSFLKKLKPFYRLTGEEMRRDARGKWWVIPKTGGRWLEFADKQSQIEYK